MVILDHGLSHQKQDKDDGHVHQSLIVSGSYILINRPLNEKGPDRNNHRKQQGEDHYGIEEAFVGLGVLEESSKYLQVDDVSADGFFFLQNQFNLKKRRSGR